MTFDRGDPPGLGARLGRFSITDPVTLRRTKDIPVPIWYLTGDGNGGTGQPLRPWIHCSRPLKGPNEPQLLQRQWLPYWVAFLFVPGMALTTSFRVLWPCRGLAPKEPSLGISMAQRLGSESISVDYGRADGINMLPNR